jgi:hypothetical protein
MKENIRVVDPDVFTDAQGAKELQANALRESLSYDAYGSQTEFDVIVLTQPIPLAPADASAVFGQEKVQKTDVGGSSIARTQGAISFKGRIIGNGFISPHASLPNPCNISMASSAGTALKVINMHTTFVSVANYRGRIPSLGDTVKVKLHAGDIKFNLQYAVFDKLSDAFGASATSNQMSKGCVTLASKFKEFDPDVDLEGYSLAYADTSGEGEPASTTANEVVVQNVIDYLIKNPSHLGYTTLADGMCGFPTDFPPTARTTKEIIERFPPKKCVTETVGRGFDNQPATVTGHPDFVNTLKEIYKEGRKQDWWKEWVQKYKVDPIIFGGEALRPISRQITYRINNCGTKDIKKIITSGTKCVPATATLGINLALRLIFVEELVREPKLMENT